jgi:hypothetical protein
MKQVKKHKQPKDKNIYDINGFDNYTEHHNERQDAGTIPVPKFLQNNITIIKNEMENNYE